MSKKFYVVWKGAKTGIFTSWPEVQQHTVGRSDAQYMGFESKQAAEEAFASTYTKALMQRSLKNGGAKKSSATKTKAKTTQETVLADFEIYCDGACSPNPGKSGTGLAVYELADNKLNLTALYYGLYQEMGTNNTAELNGLLSAFKLTQHILNSASTPKKIKILSDSKYSIDCITKWAKGWQAKGWTRGKGEEIKNLEVIKTSYALYQKLKSSINIVHVKGHADIEGNELSDRMAVLARKEKQVKLAPYTGELNIKKILAMESG